MVLENLHVKHKTFGVGTVVSTKGQYFTVKFETAEKIFVYPDIFEKFLTLDDGSVSEEILADLDKSKANKQKIIDNKREENVRAMTKGIVIPGKENAGLENEDEESSFKNKDEEEVEYFVLYGNLQ